MRNVLTLTLAAGLTLGLSGAASACSWNKTASKDMTVAEAPPVKEPVEEAVTTFEPVKDDQLEQKVVEED